MKKILSILLVLAMLLCACACGEKEVNKNLVGGDSASKGAAAELLGNLISEKLKASSDLKLSYHPNGSLGSDADLLRQAADGQLAIVICQTAPAVSFVKELAVFDLPMLFATYDGETIDKVLNGSGEFRTRLEKAYEDAGFVLLGFLQNATFRLTTSNTALNTLADFKALKIRTMENANHMAFWTAMGADPTPIPWAEVFLSLQNHTIEAQENAADTCLGTNFQDVQKYLCCTNHILYVNQVVMSKKIFDALSEDEQQAIKTASKEAISEIADKLKEMDNDAKKALTDKGMTLIEYEDSFFNEILEIPQINNIYEEINDKQTNGLANILKEELESAN